MSRIGLYLLRRLPGSEVAPPPESPEWAGLGPWFDGLALYALRIVSIAIPAMILLAWPTDWLLLEGDPAKRAIMAQWRIVSIGMLIVLAAIAWRTDLARRRPMAVIIASSCAGALWSSWCNARLGSFDSQWPYYIYFSIMFTSPLPCRVRDRVLLVVFVMASIFVGFCVLHPENLAHPQMPDAMFFLLVVAAGNAMLGVCVWAIAALHYFGQARLAEARESLAALNQTLDQRVREQTVELRELGCHLVQLQESERSRIAAELHDDLGQQLAAVRFVASSAQQSDPERASASLAEIQDLIAAANGSLRALVSTLRPLVLDQVGLAAACASLTRTMGNHAGLGYDCSVSGPVDGLARDVNVAIYRVLQEALTNVTRHAQASAVEVELTRTDRVVELIVRDDGRGLPAEPARRTDGGGMGLVGMRERAHSVGGTLQLQRPDGGGTKLTLSIPLGSASASASALGERERGF